MKNKFQHLGWQVGLSYQTPRPEGKRPDELRQLIHEMRDHGMSFLSLMLLSYSYFDDHDGYSWPPRRQSLRCYRDEHSLNADEKTEFLGDVIHEACQAGLHVQLMDTWGVWNPERIRKGYPGAALQELSDGRFADWVHCPDVPDVYRCGRDEMLDSLERYAAFGVRSYGIESVGYWLGTSSCFCRHTREAFARETGETLTSEWVQANQVSLRQWKQEHVGGILKRLADEVHAEFPKVEIWLHSTCDQDRGHSSTFIQKAGIPVVIPYMMHTAGDFSDIPQNLCAVSPLPAVGHVCVRSQPFKNYPVPPKNPDVIKSFFDAIERTEADNLIGLMFFNESCVSRENRRAVYDGIRRFL
ncbi:MAG: hypothetical protein KKE37_07315 [Verrucomicrobia bacterium]|nr:hypothetical protein [Verrucomicrobiota bacterium]MBU4248593.1 hypothetical protein [Verrucomicrobiota bacterium]MBU4290533.1 hypothetical protein [Verrucomicrobiota bacterium]MBU4429146.1 hypothetical protein [Verrucomicrobiota bacterium]MCG2680712.1 hypothetical protein [Kiritimatiellia bacterium]